MNEQYRKARALAGAAKRRLWDSLRREKNILGAGFGRRIVNGEFEDEPALVIYVARKVPARFLPPSRLLPRRVYVGGDSVEVDVFATGPFYPFAFASNVRPAPSGISIGRQADTPIDAGTLGCLVTDLTDNTLCILSCNHVLANENGGTPGDIIVQPGTYDGGTSPDDNIATLKRFVTINSTGSTVDCAIAQLNDQTLGNDVVNQMMNNLMPPPGPDHPAVGLLYAGSCNRTVLNPINDVLSQLNIQFLAGQGSTANAEVNMAVEKVGRTTEYTTANVTEIDVSSTTAYTFGDATLDNQIATAYLSDPGDSGSVVCQGGKGGTGDQCGCGSSNSAVSAIGKDLSIDQSVVEEFREKYLRHTRTGKYLILLFSENEQRITARLRATPLKSDDKALLRKLHDKYAAEIRMALLQPEKKDFRLQEAELKDLRDLAGRLSRYLEKDEREAIDVLLEIATSAKGKTVAELLAILNDERVLDRVQKAFSRVKFLEQPRRK